MKKLTTLLIIGLAWLLICRPGYSQDASKQKDFKFTIKTNPLSAMGGPFWVVVVPITGEYKVLFEAAVSKKSSLQFGASYLGPSVLLNLDKLVTDTANVNGIKTSGIKVSGMWKFFLSRDLSAPKGFYLGPHVSFASAKIADKSVAANYVKATKLNINAVIGYQMVTSGGFTLDIFTGMGFVQKKWSYNGEAGGDFDFGLDKTGVSIPLGLSFGYAF